MPDAPDADRVRAAVTVAVAALLFASADDWTDASVHAVFGAAERFVVEAEKRYGRLTDA